MKVHGRKKAYRRWLHTCRADGKINNVQGQMVVRNQIPDNSMRRDASPQAGKA